MENSKHSICVIQNSNENILSEKEGYFKNFLFSAGPPPYAGIVCGIIGLVLAVILLALAALGLFHFGYSIHLVCQADKPINTI